MASLQEQLDELQTLFYVISGVFGALIFVLLVGLGVVFYYAKNIAGQLKNVEMSAGSGPTSLLPRLDAPMKQFGQSMQAKPQFNRSPSFAGTENNWPRNEQPQGFPGRGNPLPQRQPFTNNNNMNSGGSVMNDPQGAFSYGNPSSPQRPAAPYRPGGRAGY